MTRIGYFLSAEQFTPAELIDQARKAEDAGFDSLWVSDHYHPWTDAQGQSAFVWSVIGALSQATSLPVTTAVTCPTVRIHPAIVAQAAATCSVMLDGRFKLGVGSGEALNEHILGDAWPETDVRLEMLEEAIDVIRLLWTGGFQSHHGKHYTVEQARIYTLPAEPPDIMVSGFGPKAVDLAARKGDGYCLTMPDKELIDRFHSQAGEGKEVEGGVKACWDEDADKAKEIAWRLWANESAPGELAQTLPSPRHFEQVIELIEPDDVAGSVPCGPDMARHEANIGEMIDAGCDRVYVQQIGPDMEGFFERYSKEILPNFT